MKSFFAACAAIALIAVGAHYALDQAPFSSADVTSDRATVRLD
jgi:hypothetical protein